MRTTTIFCDICGDTEKDFHWTCKFGAVVLSFKDVASCQAEYLYKDVCPKCTRELENNIKNTLNKLKNKSNEDKNGRK